MNWWSRLRGSRNSIALRDITTEVRRSRLLGLLKKTLQGAKKMTEKVNDSQQQTAKEPEEAKFDELKTDGSGGQTVRDINFLLDVPLEVTVELGRTKMLIQELIQLGQGSVIELEKLAGEPMEILVNNKLIAKGEVVVVNEKFGVRLTDTISPVERIRQLK
ncbi:MAG: flagellar motor switch protein FliN [Nitrospirae bacterium]|nr:flagellar motor switch protein FliN [Nitrospirota bacterium]